MSKREKEKEDRGEHYRFSGLGGTNSLLTSFTFSPTSPNFDTLDYFSLCLLCIPWFVWAILLRNVYVSLVFWDTFCERILILSWRGLSTSHNQDLTLDFPATWSSFTFFLTQTLSYHKYFKSYYGLHNQFRYSTINGHPRIWKEIFWPIFKSLSKRVPKWFRTDGCFISQIIFVFTCLII